MYLPLETINVGHDDGPEIYVALVNLSKVDVNIILDSYALLDFVNKASTRWPVDELVLKWLGEIYLYDVADVEVDDPLMRLAENRATLSESTQPAVLTVQGRRYRAVKATNTRIILTTAHVCFRAHLGSGRIVETMNVSWAQAQKLANQSDAVSDEHGPSLRRGDIDPAEFAAGWGCDPAYDNPPNHRGDGYLFYNYASENQPKDATYLTKLIGAVDRTILCVQQAAHTVWTPLQKGFNVAELEYFKELLKAQLSKLADVSRNADAS